MKLELNTYSFEQHFKVFHKISILMPGYISHSLPQSIAKIYFI